MNVFACLLESLYLSLRMFFHITVDVTSGRFLSLEEAQLRKINAWFVFSREWPALMIFFIPHRIVGIVWQYMYLNIFYSICCTFSSRGLHILACNIFFCTQALYVICIKHIFLHPPPLQTENRDKLWFGSGSLFYGLTKVMVI